MKKIKESIKYYDKFNPYLKFVLMAMTFLIFIREEFLFVLLGLVAIALIIGFDFLNRQYSSLIKDNKIYPLGALYMYNGILVLGLLKVVYETIIQLPYLVNNPDDYMFYELTSAFFNIGYTIFIGSAVIIAYYYIMYGTLNLSPRLKDYKETNMLTDILISKLSIAAIIGIAVIMFYEMFYGSAYSMIYQIASFKVDAFNIISRNGQTIYAYNHVADFIISIIILLSITKLGIKILNGREIKTELGMLVYMLFIYLNLGMLQVNGDGSMAAYISESLSVIINTIVFSQIFNYVANQYKFNSKLFTVKLPILVLLLSIVSYWHFIVGGLALLVCMNFKYNIIQRVKEA